MTDSEGASGAHVWICEEGHRYAIADIAMVQAVVEPRCGITKGEQAICGARLVRRASRLPDIGAEPSP